MNFSRERLVSHATGLKSCLSTNCVAESPAFDPGAWTGAVRWYSVQTMPC